MTAAAPSGERFVDVGDAITLCYETFGDPSHPPLLLVMGLGMQMIAWHDDFCAQLAGEGFHVIRFDNRDAGRSTSIAARPPGLGQLATRRFGSDQYTLEDMADDAAGLLRELDLAPAHVVGASLGGMVAQSLAARHPGCVARSPRSCPPPAIASRASPPSACTATSSRSRPGSARRS